MLLSNLNGWGALLRRLGRAQRLAVVLGGCWLALLGAGPALAQASLAVQHDSYAASESGGDGDGIIGPGDSFTLSEKLISADPRTLTHVSGTLTSSDGSATVAQGASAYQDLAFGVATANATPFSLTVPATADCGVNLPLSVQISTDQGSQTVPFTVSTGAAGTAHSFDSTQVPLAIPDVGYVISTLQVNRPGRVKAVRVRLGSLTHTYDGDLRIELIAPDGTSVTLINPDSANSGQNFTNTVFEQNPSDPLITSGVAPYTGSFRPVGNLDGLVGKQQQGTWNLKVSDVSPGNVGTLVNWGPDLTPAVCTSTPLASIDASPNPAPPGTQITFDGSGSRAPTPGASITDYRWDLDGSGNYATDSGTTPTVTHTYSARGKVTVGLRITDSSGKTGQTTIPVSVTQPPTAALSVSPGAPVAASPVTFDASGSTHDPAGSLVDYRWDLDGSGNYATDTGATGRITTTYRGSGTIPVHVRVTDDTGASAVAGQSVVISNAPPVASLTTPSPILVGQSAVFDGSASRDPDGTIVDYRWDFAGNGTYTTDTGSSSQASTTYTAPGTVNVGLRVTDDQGAGSFITRAVQVTRAPVARLSAQPDPATTGQNITLDAGHSTSPDGVIASYQWDLDGSGHYATSSGSAPFLVHAFPAAGNYPVSVRVTDNYGATATATLVIPVTKSVNSLGPPLGGNLLAGIASLSATDQKAILAGSDKYFASITGSPFRRAKLLGAHGLWLNCLADRAATFTLTLELSRADAQTLKLVRRVRGRQRRRQSALVAVGAAKLRLGAAGQKPFDVLLTKRLARALRRLRHPVKLLVVGSAVDAAGHHAQLARVFVVKR